MYDNFIIDYPLPLASWIPDAYKQYIDYTFASEGFQSKDLSCVLNNYFISNDGHIFEDEFDFADKNPVNRKPIYFHGHIKVYCPVYISDDDSRDIKTMLWFEYDLKFTDSLLVSATMISPKIEHVFQLDDNIKGNSWVDFYDSDYWKERYPDN